MICYTYDYELFFKDSGTVENCLIKPTNLILDFFKKNNQYGTFFIDALFLEKLQSIQEQKSEYEKIINQIHRMISEGSRIELHLHTHWLDAKYSNGNWIFPHYDRYRIQTLSKIEIKDIFKRTIYLLNSIAREVEVNYSVSCFRAGGWCIQPFDKLYNAFIENNIVVDSSLAIGISESNVREYNFDNIHLKNKLFWNFKYDPLIESFDGGITEIPIHTIKRSPIIRLIRKITLKKDKKYGDGKGLVFTTQIPKFKLLINWLKNSEVMFSTDDISDFESLRFLKNYDKNKSYVIINHPKNLKMNFGLKPYIKFKNLQAITLYDYFKMIKKY
jgi:hypothetical protein